MHTQIVKLQFYNFINYASNQTWNIFIKQMNKSYKELNTIIST